MPQSSKALAVKTFHLAIRLLNIFHSKPDHFCSGSGEDALVENCYDFLSGKMTRKDFLQDLDLTYDLNSKDLNKALKGLD